MDKERSHLTAEIDLAAITHNCQLLRKLTPPGSRICVAVKCNAYGHGIEVCLPAFESANVDMFAVATVDEARQLRELKVDIPILLLGSEFSIYQGGKKKDIAHWLIENDIRLTVMNSEDVDSLAGAAEKLNKKAIVHLMLDSGMSRMGLNEKSLLDLIDVIKKNDHIEIEGLYTHFSSADEPDKTYTNYQLKRFDKFVTDLKDTGLNIPIVHAANSAATIDLPASHYDMIRPGIAVYGYQPGPKMINKVELKPTMKLLSRLIAVKKLSKGTFAGYGNTWQAPEDTVIGLVPIGYGDGFNRHLSNSGKMTIADQSVPIIGRVSMDLTILDLGWLIGRNVEVFPGMEVTVIDSDPNAPNSVENIAAELDTISYEIVTNLGSRIKRIGR